MRFNNSNWVVGPLSFLAVTVALGISTSFAAGAQRVDVIDCLPTTTQVDSMKMVRDHAQRVDVIDTIGSEGPAYLATIRPMRVDVIDRIGPQVRLHGSSVDAETMSLGVSDNLLALKSQFESTTPSYEKLARVDVIDNLPAKGQWDSEKTARTHPARVDVIDTVAWRGDVYPSTTGATRVDLIEDVRL